MTWRRHWGIIAILLVYVGLAVGYSLITPPFEAPDEIHHYAFIRDLIRDHALPIQLEGDRPSQRHQPPLYYLAGALVSFWVDEPAGSPYSIARSNPYWGYGYGEVGHDNKNLYLHGTWDHFPYQGTALGIHVVRLLSVLMGALAVLTTYAIGRELFPNQKALALGGVAFIAFNPMFLFMNGAVNNDNLIALLVTLILWGLVRTLKGGITIRRSVFVGVMSGLALLTKLTGLYVLPVVALAFLLAAWPRRDWQRLVQGGAIVAGLIVLIAGWWFVRNMVLYGELTSIKLTLHTWHARPEGFNWRTALFELPNAETSFWARFGYGNVPVPNWIYQLLGIVSRLAALGCVGLACHAAVGRYAASSRTRRAIALFVALAASLVVIYSAVTITGISPLGLYAVSGLLALAALFLVLRRGEATTWLVQGNEATGVILALTLLAYFAAMFSYMTVSTTAANGRYMFPGLAGAAILMFVGLVHYLPRGWMASIAAAILNLGMAALSLLVLLLYLGPAYLKPAILPAEASGTVPQNLNIEYDHQVRLLGCAVQPARVRPGDVAQVTLYWQALQEMSEDYSVFVQVFGRDGQRIGQRDSFPGLGAYPTGEWKPGEVVVDIYPVPIDPGAAAPVEALIDAGLYRPGNMDRLPVFDATGQKLGRPTVARLKLAPRKKPHYEWQQAVKYTLGDKIALRGYDIAQDELKAGGTLRLTFYWQALAGPGKNYTVFVHLIDDAGTVRAQQDSQPVQGSYPSSLWEKDEVIEDVHTLPLPSDLPAGHYRVALGMYLLETMERLPALDGQGARLPDDRIFLWDGTID